MDPPRNAAGSNLSGDVYVKLPFTFKAGLAGSPTFVNDEHPFKAVVYNGSWQPQAYIMYVYQSNATALKLKENSQALPNYTQNAGTRLILNFTATYFSG